MAAASPSGSSLFEALKLKKQAKVRWQALLKNALDADTWGQSIEATEEYEQLYRLLEQQIPDLQLTLDEKSVCTKVAHAVSLRMHTLQGVEAAINDQQGSAAQAAQQKVSLEDIKSLQAVLTELFDKPQGASAFPIELHNYTATLPSKDSAAGEVLIAHDDGIAKEERGSLMAPPKVRAGLTTIAIKIEKIGLKDAETYINSYLTVSVADSAGNVVESQDTPKSNALKPSYVHFGNTVYVQLTVEEIQQKNLCLFFEFKHYKPSKKKISTRCYAVLEAKELSQANGKPAVCLELYKKPTDFSRKSLALFTIKQLYLHLAITFTKH